MKGMKQATVMSQYRSDNNNTLRLQICNEKVTSSEALVPQMYNQLRAKSFTGLQTCFYFLYNSLVPYKSSGDQFGIWPSRPVLVNPLHNNTTQHNRACVYQASLTLACSVCLSETNPSLLNARVNALFIYVSFFLFIYLPFSLRAVFLVVFSPSLQTQETPPEVLSGETVTRDQEPAEARVFLPVRQRALERQGCFCSGVSVHK